MKRATRHTFCPDRKPTLPRLARVAALALCLICVPPIVTPSMAGPAACIGDCNDNRRTTVDELVRLVNLALSGAAVAACPAGDVDGNERITVEELVSAVRTSLGGCAALPPTIDVDALCFVGTTGAPTPEQFINVLKATGEWTAEASASWLSVTPAQGQAPSTARISVDASGLSEGIHEATVTIRDTTAASASVAVVFNLARVSTTAGWSIQTVEPITSAGQTSEPNGSVAQKTSLALGTDDRPGITFYRNDAQVDRQLRFTQFTGCRWSSADIERFGIDGSLAFDGNGDPHVSFVRVNGGLLRYARRRSGSWQVETVEEQIPRGDTGHRSSIAIDGAGQPHITFLLKFLPNNVFTYDLRYAVRGGETWSIETADAQGTPGWDTSLVLTNPGGEPRVTYHTDLPDALRYAEKRGDTWVSESIAAGGKPSSLRLDADGQPRVAFHGLPGSSVNFAYRDNGVWDVENIDRQGTAPHPGGRPFAALALDAAGVAHVAYPDFSTGTLKYASRTGPDSWQIQVIDEGPDIGDFCSLAIDHNEVAHISYLDLATGLLKYARGPARP